MNPSLELRENVLFSSILNYNTLNSGKVVNSYHQIIKKTENLKKTGIEVAAVTLQKPILFFGEAFFKGTNRVNVKKMSTFLIDPAG